MNRRHRKIFPVVIILILVTIIKDISGKYGYERAVFAGGCFWCLEPPFDGLDGVIEVIPGYTGGYLRDPSYKEVSSGQTGHMEAVKIIYDPEKITYTQLIARIYNS